MKFFHYVLAMQGKMWYTILATQLNRSILWMCFCLLAKMHALFQHPFNRTELCRKQRGLRFSVRATPLPHFFIAPNRCHTAWASARGKPHFKPEEERFLRSSSGFCNNRPYAPRRRTVLKVSRLLPASRSASLFCGKVFLNYLRQACFAIFLRAARRYGFMRLFAPRKSYACFL